MASEDTMDDRSGSQAPSDATATAGEVEDDVAREAPPGLGAGAVPVRVLVSPVAAADADNSAARMVPPPAYTGVLYLQQRHQWPPARQQSEEEDDDADPKRMRAKWFNDMRGWLVVLSVQVASVTYQAGLNPPESLKDNNKSEFPKGKRYYMFYYFNTTAFVTSLAIVILLLNRSFYHSEAKVVALEIIVVLDMVGLMGAYWAGSTRADQTAKYTLVLTLLVLFALYVVYTVQLLPKLWRLAAAAAAAVPTRVPAARGSSLRVPTQIDEARSSLQLPPQDENVGRSVSVLRRRGSSRLAGAAGAEPSPASRMMSP